MAQSQRTLKKTAPAWGDAVAHLRPSWDELERFLGARLVSPANGGRPKYRALQDALVEAIREGVIALDHRLPTESELTRITPFSLGTVQRALKSLVDAGLLLRKPGVGTIVSPWRSELEHPLHTRFLGENGEVLPVYTEVSARRTIATPGPWSEFLGTDDKTLQIVRRLYITRPESAGGEFSYYNEFYVDAARFPVFRDTPKRSLNGVNFKRLMAKEFNLAITRVSNHLGIVTASEEIAPILGVDAGTACIRQRVFVFSGEGPLYYQEYWIPPHAQELLIDSALDSLVEI